MTSTPRIPRVEPSHAIHDILAKGAHGVPRFRTVLACVDGARSAENVLAWTREVARTHGARVVVASVLNTSVPGAALGTMYAVSTGIAEAYQHAEAEGRAHVEEAVARLRAAGVDTELVITHGSVAKALADIADTHHADLVILGSHGGGSVSRVALGSVANALLDRVAASVLVVRAPPPYRRILAATDGSPSSYRAVAYALRQADLAEAELTVQHVLEWPPGAEDIPASGLLRDVIARMELRSHPAVSYVLDEGRPADRILAKAQEMGADLIVVGSRGLGTVLGLLLGSVSHKVVNAASASVLVVKDV